MMGKGTFTLAMATVCGIHFAGVKQRGFAEEFSSTQTEKMGEASLRRINSQPLLAKAYTAFGGLSEPLWLANAEKEEIVVLLPVALPKFSAIAFFEVTKGEHPEFGVRLFLCERLKIDRKFGPNEFMKFNPGDPTIKRELIGEEALKWLNDGVPMKILADMLAEAKRREWTSHQ